MRISILINSITAGGAERVVSLLLEELKNDFDIHLVLLSNVTEYTLPEGQKIFCLNQPVGGNGFLKLLKLPLLALRYKKYCRENNIEASLSFLKRANFINCLSKMMGSKSRVIISERTYLTNYLAMIGGSGKAITSLLTKKLYPKADLIIANASLIKKDLEENFNIRSGISVIYNPVNIPVIQQASGERVDPGLFSTFTFISVGGFRQEKNYGLLIDAFNRIKDLDCNLLLLGKGEEENKLKTQVKRLGLESRIYFAGFDNNPYKYLAKASCFVLSSDFEGFPNSIQEALACKLPVISTDCRSGPREILAPGSDINKNLHTEIEIGQFGILVPVKSPGMLEKGMRLIYADSALRDKLSSGSFKRAMDFDLPGIALQYKNAISGEK
jgi:N-acetylgalactosamine-N,N'-diacetylbacillosaminyl-diphospho-undecaprenol 4-alpha-N-acetylgalactosaminyltransferase